jgi:hypothetical protein
VSDVPPGPRLPLTVPLSLWGQLAALVSPAFADSYLSGAQLSGDRLTPRTLTAFERLRESLPARGLLQGLGLDLIKPEPFRG